MSPPNHLFSADPAAENDWSQRIANWSVEERTEKEKKLLRRIDWRLLPALFVMYIMNYIDRNALPQARVQGLEDDIGLVGVEYNVTLSLTFIGYIAFQSTCLQVRINRLRMELMTDVQFRRTCFLQRCRSHDTTLEPG